MAVAYSTHASVATGGTTQNPTRTITVAGTNPVLFVCVGISSTTTTVSSISWSLGGGTPVNLIGVRNSDSYLYVGVIPAPTAGAGTVTVNKSAAGDVHQIDVLLFTGADQTTPSAIGDVVSVADSSDGQTLTASNLVAGDASLGAASSTQTGNPTGVTPNAVYTNNSTADNFQTGYATGTASITFTYDSTSFIAQGVVRIAQAAGAPSGSLLTRGVKDLSGGMSDMSGGMG